MYICTIELGIQNKKLLKSLHSVPNKLEIVFKAERYPLIVLALRFKIFLHQRIKHVVEILDNGHGLTMFS